MSFIYSLNEQLSANSLPGSVLGFRDPKIKGQIPVFQKHTIE